ncbi:MAG: hypothetical protein H6R14_2888 [Proteobacteria bacterium]|nr:hypothetical protein [Pseudomonadota bacterium]
MPIEKQLEIAQMLARFKLQVKRSLGESVDLEKLTRDASYARQRLAEIEEAATEEELLVMVLRLRDLLVPLDQPNLAAAAPAAPALPDMPGNRETRSYLMGARSW